jgi:hypothetical protein
VERAQEDRRPFGEAEKHAMFYGTAARIYRLEP